MLSHPFDKLLLDNGSTLILTPCPGTKGVGLAESLNQLAQAGARAVITLMPEDEMRINHVNSMPLVRMKTKLEWLHFPIKDNTSPGKAFHHAWQRAKQRIQELLDEKQDIAIHCKGGSGRTGLTAAIIMLERGTSYAEVVTRVRALRPKSLQLAVHANYLAGNYDRRIAGMLSDARAGIAAE